MFVTECGSDSIWNLKASLSGALCTDSDKSAKWMPSKRPTQNVRNDGNPSLLAPASRIDRDSRAYYRVKDQKIGEGTYAVVYRGPSFARVLAHPLISHQGREASTSRKVAIKKIKVGQFKDGLDMSAVREVKYLRELHHQNIIEVVLLLFVACFI